MLFHTLGANLAHEDRISLVTQRNQPDIRSITLVARTRMRQFRQLYFHALSTSTEGVISLFGISAGQYATISSTFGRPPAKPVTAGGPVRINGAISFVKRSIAARSWPRTPTRNWIGRASCRERVEIPVAAGSGKQ